MVQIKRAYERPTKTDGYRVLIDRLWPRGVKKPELSLDDWLRELAPSDGLRKEFGHDPRRWDSFRRRYERELRGPAAREKIEFLYKIARRKKLTLVYGARDEEHNNAVVLKGLIDRRLKRASA